MSSQIKMEEEDSMGKFNPWNKDVNLLERVLESHDLIMKEDKGDREAAKVEAMTTKVVNKAKVGASKAEVSIKVNIATKEKVEAMYTMVVSKASVEDNNNNLEHRERGRSKE